MSFELSFLGAAQTVTGSMHVVKSDRATVLLDCGLFQGRRHESFERNRRMPAHLRNVDAVVLSHAHIDHSGALPLLVKNGYRGPIYCTPATRDLCAAMLEDSARIQMHDANYIRRSIERHEAEMEPVEPLYDLNDVARTLEQMVAVPYHRRMTVAQGFDVRFLDAGHVLGSAIVSLYLDDVGTERHLVFTGDLGRRHGPILRDPEVPHGASFLVMESTYGDRLHEPFEAMDEKLATLVQRVVARGGKVVVPTFALERAQEVMLALRRIHDRGHLPRVSVYVDSPLTVKVTDVFRLHPDCFDEETRALITSTHSPFEFPGLEFIESVEDSKRISRSDEPAIILSASGMAENGRILHHLRATLGDARNAVAIVGFQAQHTLGRRLVEKRPEVRIFGVMQPRLAEVVVFNGMSAHADRNDLLWFADAVRASGPLEGIALVHGEPPAQRALESELTQRGFPSVHVPQRGDRVVV